MEPSKTTMLTVGVWCARVQEYFSGMETMRAHEMERLVRKYQSVGPQLIKVEGLVVHTNTGRNPRLFKYYAHWERQCYTACTK